MDDLDREMRRLRDAEARRRRRADVLEDVRAAGRLLPRRLESLTPAQALEDARRDCVSAICDHLPAATARTPYEVLGAETRVRCLRVLAEVAVAPPRRYRGWSAIELDWGAAVRTQACLEVARLARACVELGLWAACAPHWESSGEWWRPLALGARQRPPPAPVARLLGA